MHFVARMEGHKRTFALVARNPGTAVGPGPLPDCA
jgi:hypothetical protein